MSLLMAASMLTVLMSVQPTEEVSAESAEPVAEEEVFPVSPLHPDIIPAVIKAARNNANGFTFFIDRIVPFSIFSRLNQGIPIQFKWFLNYSNKRQSPVIQRSGDGLYHYRKK